MHPSACVGYVNCMRGSKTEVFTSVFVNYWIDLDDGGFDPVSDQRLRGDACSKATE